MSEGRRADELAVHPEKAPAFMAHAVLHFTEQAGRILEVVAVVAIGSMLSGATLTRDALWLVLALFVVARPAAVWVGLVRSGVGGLPRRMIGWFGVRGVGSLYYLSFAITHGFVGTDASRVAHLALAVVAASVVVHGISVTPLMSFYRRAAGEGR